MSTVIGRRGFLKIERSDLRVLVRVLEVRVKYGHTRYRVCPIAGTGEHWVNADRVTLEAA